MESQSIQRNDKALGSTLKFGSFLLLTAVHKKLIILKTYPGLTCICAETFVYTGSIYHRPLLGSHETCSNRKTFSCMF